MNGENANFGGISVSAQQIQQVLGSPAGKQLIAHLQKTGGTQLQAALTAAKNGDTAQAKQTMEALLQQKEAAALLSRMGNG